MNPSEQQDAVFSVHHTPRRFGKAILVLLLTTAILGISLGIYFAIFSQAAESSCDSNTGYGSTIVDSNSNEYWVISPSAHQDPHPSFCDSYTNPMASAAEILESTSPSRAYVAMGIADDYYDSWPNDLPRNTACSPCGSAGPFVKNMGQRNVITSGVCIWRSPDISEQQCLSTGNCLRVITYYPPPPNTPALSTSILNNYMRWMHLANEECIVSYPNNATIVDISSSPPAGQVYAWIADKCMSFEWNVGTTYVELTDEWGNSYIMHATYASGVNGGTVDLDSIALPAHWSIARRQRSTGSPLRYWPHRWQNEQGVDSGHCLSVVLRDNMGNGYHQLTWGSHTNASRAEGYLSVIASSAQCQQVMTSQGFLVRPS